MKNSKIPKEPSSGAFVRVARNPRAGLKAITNPPYDLLCFLSPKDFRTRTVQIQSRISVNKRESQGKSLIFKCLKNLQILPEI